MTKRIAELEHVCRLLLEVVERECKVNPANTKVIRAAHETLDNPPRKEGDWRSAIFRNGGTKL